MRHLIISREFPPAAYPPGGIGTYVANIARLMAERGEVVHVVGERWHSAPDERVSLCEGRLIVHRIGRDDLPRQAGSDADRLRAELDGLKASTFPNQWFAWHAALLAERLIEEEGIDIVEGQEWEAPLHYFLLRRQLGLGPSPRPPCIVHLHSASAMIRRYNGLPSVPAAFPLMRRMEEFCIRSADALLCPSAFYAAQCSSHFGLPKESIHVIPLPLGPTPTLERSEAVWERGSICFVGRLEPRKGVIEWMKAAARVAGEDHQVKFDFVGADVCGLRRTLVTSLSPGIRPRFRFHGSKPPEGVLEHLSVARAAVVPSRWENFPNVCVEAMRSGLPVISTRLGGMTDLIEDGRTGWLAPDTGIAGMVDGLAAALCRCLAASGAERARMGSMAAAWISEVCDNEKVVRAHLAYRAELAARAGHRSPSQSGGDAVTVAGTPASVSSGAANCRAGVVVQADAPDGALPVLASLARQTSPAGAACVVLIGPPGENGCQPGLSQQKDVMVLHRPGLERGEAWNAGVRELSGRGLKFWLFLDAHDTLHPACLARLGGVFARRPDVGVVALWTRRPADAMPLDAPACPDAVHQLLANEVAPASAFRAEAFDPNAGFPPGMPREFDIWALANQVIAAGWTVVALPEALATRRAARPVVRWPEATALPALRAEVLAPFSSGPARNTLELLDLYVPVPGIEPKLPGRLQAFRQRAARVVDLFMEDPRLAVRNVASELLFRLVRRRGLRERMDQGHGTGQPADDIGHHLHPKPCAVSRRRSPERHRAGLSAARVRDHRR